MANTNEVDTLADVDIYNSRMNYTVMFKRRVILRTEEIGNVAVVSCEFHVPRSNIQRWRKKADKFKEGSLSADRNQRNTRRLGLRYAIR